MSGRIQGWGLCEVGAFRQDETSGYCHPERETASKPVCHPRESGDPFCRVSAQRPTWIPAFAGMTDSACCHPERSEESALDAPIQKCRFLASLGMTMVVPSKESPPVDDE